MIIVEEKKSGLRIASIIAMLSLLSVFPVQSSAPVSSPDPSNQQTNSKPRTSAPKPALKVTDIVMGKQRRGPIIPQNRARAWVPQGLEYYSNGVIDWYILSFYFDRGRGHEGHASRLSVVDQKTGKKVKSVELYEEDGNTKHIGHVGGVTVADRHIYVASTVGKDNLILRYPIEHLVQLQDGQKLVADKVYRLPSEHRTSYIKHHKQEGEDWLFVGQWVPKNSKKRGKLRAYRLDEQGEIHFVREYETPNSVQGVALVGDLAVYIISTGRKDPTRIVAAKLRTNQVIKRHTLSTRMGQNAALTSEGLVVVNESGAKKYEKGGSPDPYMSIVPVKLKSEVGRERS